MNDMQTSLRPHIFRDWRSAPVFGMTSIYLLVCYSMFRHPVELWNMIAFPILGAMLIVSYWIIILQRFELKNGFIEVSPRLPTFLFSKNFWKIDLSSVKQVELKIYPIRYFNHQTHAIPALVFARPPADVAWNQKGTFGIQLPYGRTLEEEEVIQFFHEVEKEIQRVRS